MDLLLTGQRAVVTGASRGIGLAVALGLAAEGSDVALVARDAAALDAAAAQVTALGVRALPVVADTSDDAAVRAMVERVVAEWGGVDVLVNAAATPAGGPVPALADLTDDAMRAEFETKVLGYLRCARAVAPHMIAQGGGRIVNVSGLAARQSGSIAGSVRNVAVAALTKNLADELGPSGVGVTVVHPGLTVTERIPALLAARAEAQGTTSEEVAAGLGAATSIGRLPTAQEVADVVVFLCSPRSVAVTGDAVAAGGGARGAIHY
ncbi:SDR family NAD(P)-dependent oxidoreductase [Pseudonocardia abyssalis]|uniref:SDR family NAD(P)-dependent oxidoreductase n=1 Tax=Pseudonocardia abyssalis TaxID=2792008 RepID=A0ABS6UNZ0_9PSEU|nr:SDR family NAD(P)-dependent oxidoreductase [Pseudonocardia abyssalis]MBW0114781.1 SDR family NAD(P)-dependent oxidoreductase [Pseudonocardia abyssalis]MBW0133975.1 SDR family NAD(P)-dependent oxidoreductase [Pseudonocardia abyssalis]